MRNYVKAQVREVITAQRKRMANVEVIGLNRSVVTTNTNLNWAKALLESEQRKARKMMLKTQDWARAYPAHKVAYLLHDTNRAELAHAVAELEQDLKTLNSRLNPTAAEYSAHYWNIDVDVYIYCNSRNAGGSENDDASDISDAETEAYFEAIKKCLRGEFCIDWGCGGRGFTFYADAADEDKLNELLNGLEKRGCLVEYRDWDEINAGTREEE